MAQRNERELAVFLSALFSSDDLVEVRPIEVWTDIGTGTRRSRVLRQHRLWVTPNHIIALQHELGRLNVSQNANIFMGVNPRASVGGGKKSDIRFCRCIWADLDCVTPEIARWRCEEIGVGDPSIIVDSGNGVHLYWLLHRPFMVASANSLAWLEACLKHLYRQLGCDATSDVNRLLRLPGYMNVKDARNGVQPMPCRLVRCDPSRRYTIHAFEAPKEKRPHGIPKLATQSVPHQPNDMRGQLRRLDHDVRDRSERDFGVVCALLRAGLGECEIRDLVMDRSKFSSNGTKYFQMTFANAVAATSSERC